MGEIEKIVKRKRVRKSSSQLLKEIVPAHKEEREIKPEKEGELTEIQKEQVKRWLIELYSPKEISQLISLEFKKTYGEKRVKEFLLAHEEEIQPKREAFLKDIAKIPETSKSVRISRLVALLNKLREKIEKGERVEVYAREYRETLKQIADEAGDLVKRTKSEKVLKLGDLLTSKQRTALLKVMEEKQKGKVGGRLPKYFDEEEFK